MATESPRIGDQVSWQWSGSRPSGTVAEVKDHGHVSITSNKGNVISRNAEPGDPAVHVERSGNDVVKRAHELRIDEPANGAKEEKKAEDNTTNGHAEPAKEDEKEEQEKPKEPESKPEEKQETKAEPKKDDTTHAGEKHSLEEDTPAKAPEKKAEEPKASNAQAKEKTKVTKADVKEPAAKKQKTETVLANTSRGRPKKEAEPKAAAPKKKKEAKPAATVDGKPRRSARLTK